MSKFRNSKKHSLFDKLGNRTIITKELKNGTFEIHEEMIRDADVDGHINYKEFVRMMMAK